MACGRRTHGIAAPPSQYFKNALNLLIKHRSKTLFRPQALHAPTRHIPPMSWDWHWFTLPGNAALVLPVALALGLPLIGHQANRPAVFAWWSALAVAVLLTAASKIAFYGWGTGIRAWNLTCFSGHTVLALGFWPVALSLLAPAGNSWLRRSLVGSGWALGLLIATSRGMLQAHPWSEVIAGALLGSAVALIGLRIPPTPARPSRWPALLLPALLISGLARLDQQLPLPKTEGWFADIGTILTGREHPVNRERWLKRD